MGTANKSGSGKLKVQYWPLDRINPNPRNPRTHTEEQVAQIAASIVEFGWTNPVLVGSDGVIIAGHARLLAARKLGLSEVPVIVLDHLTETQRQALLLIDNKLAQNSGWDDDLLRAALEELTQSDLDLTSLGWSTDELHEILAGASTNEPDEDELNEHLNAIMIRLSIPGSVWLGCRDRIINRLETLGKTYNWKLTILE